MRAVTLMCEGESLRPLDVLDGRPVRRRDPDPRVLTAASAAFEQDEGHIANLKGLAGAQVEAQHAPMLAFI